MHHALRPSERATQTAFCPTIERSRVGSCSSDRGKSGTWANIVAFRGRFEA